MSASSVAVTYNPSMLAPRARLPNVFSDMFLPGNVIYDRRDLFITCVSNEQNQRRGTIYQQSTRHVQAQRLMAASWMSVASTAEQKSCIDLLPPSCANLAMVLCWLCKRIAKAFHPIWIAQLGERQTEDLKVPGSIPGLGEERKRETERENPHSCLHEKGCTGPHPKKNCHQAVVRAYRKDVIIAFIEPS